MAKDASSEAEIAQRALLAAFCAGEVDGIGRPDQRIDTHLSHVFLNGQRAFKLKRAVKLPFVDFTGLSAREGACRAELSINAGPARKLYVRAAPIVRRGHGFALGCGDEASSEIVDWVVEMRRFDQADQFDRLAASGRLSVELIETTASMVARLHQEAPPRQDGEDMRTTIATLRRTSAEGAARLSLAFSWAALIDQIEAAFKEQEALIERRRLAGKMRRGHGDLHLRNLCLFEGEPIAFDALEFDDALATSDVLYDLAFLLMDLRRCGLPAHANAALNRYWDEAAEDEKALCLLPLFMSLRACVRMAVALEAGRAEEAQDYARLGLSLLQPCAHVVVALGGLSGVGKTAVARALAPRLPGSAGARILRSDVLRKCRLGIAPETHAAAQAYEPAARARIYHDLMIAAGSAAVSTSVVIDATFETPYSRDLAESHFGARLRAYWLHAPLGVRLARIAGRRHDASDADAAVAAAQREPENIDAAWRRVDAQRLPDEIAEYIADT